MDDVYYLLERELQELLLAKQATSRRVRDIHLNLAIAYNEKAIAELPPRQTWIVAACP